MPPKPPAEASVEATAIFEGRTFDPKPIDDRHVLYVFEVTRYWKGEVGPTVEIVTPKDSAMCGRYYEPGKPYLIYASTQDGKLHDMLCSRTRVSADAGEDFAVLGEGRKPTAPETEAPTTEPPRVETTAGETPAGPPPTTPHQRGCSIDIESSGLAAGLLLPLLFVSRRRFAR